MVHAIGIDLGTTNSVVARLDEYGKPVVLPNRHGETTTPSVICFQDGVTVVGAEAKELQAAGASQVAAFFKRQMGVPHYVFYADGHDHTAIDLSATLISTLKHDAEAAIGGPVTHAVITVPAYFRNPQREDTLAAGRAAGLEVLRIVNEPTAAAIAYGFSSEQTKQRLLVYDLGGGTFDVTVLSLEPGEIRILTSDGNHELGGKDWDDRIVEFLATRFEMEFGCDPLEDLETLSDLQVRAEDAKKRLSAAQSTQVSLVHQGERGRYTLERATFDEITADLMERTMSLTRGVLDDQGLRPTDLDGVLLVGGSTRMPMVHDFVKRFFGRPPKGGLHVDEAVALGAAHLAADCLADMGLSEEGRPSTSWRLGGAVHTVDVTNHSLGMVAVNEDRSAYLNSLILPKNQPLPCREMRPYQHRTQASGDNHLEVFMTQGESGSPADVTFLGRYLLHDVPHTAGGMTVIDIEYSYDTSGTVQVSGRARGGPALPVTVEELPPDIPERFLGPPEVIQEAVHVTAYLAFDLSGSMSGDPLREAKKAAISFVRNCDLSHCSIGLIAFANRVEVELRASQDARRIERAITSLSIGDKLGYGNQAHPFQEVRGLLQKVEGPRFVITLADGVWADQDVATRCAKACHREGIESIAIGFGGADQDFLKAIASTDEASFFTNMGGLVETFTNIAQVLTESQGGVAVPNSASGGSHLSWFGRLRKA